MSNTVLIWIVLPIAVGVAMSLLQRWRKVYHLFAVFSPLILAVLAALFSSGLVLTFAGRQFVLADSLTILGRNLQITANQLGMVSLLYLVCFAWNTLSRLFGVSQWFGSLSLVITGLWVSVQFLNPFIYSAVVIELIALISVPLLSPRGLPAKSGIIRFLSMQTIALPLILLSGWMVSGIETSPSAEDLVLRGALLVLLGFVLWLGIFPLHSWLPMLTEESHPWTTTFLLGTMQLSLTFFFLKVLNQYGWLRTLPALDLAFKWIGALCILSAGLIAAFQKNINRLLGYFFLAETGYIILAIAFRNFGGIQILTLTLMPRILGYWALGFALSSLQQATESKSLDLEGLRGLIWRFPITSLLLLVSILNIIGMPLFAVYPSKHILWNLLPIDTLPLSILVAIGVLGMLTLFLRLFSTLIHPNQENPGQTAEEPKQESVGMILAVVFISFGLILLGVLPNVIIGPFENLLSSFQNLLR